MDDHGRVVALESDNKRIGKISENSRRLSIRIIKPVPGDAATYREGTYDKILIDAPCSGLGVLRRHPDGRWTKTEESISERASLQKKILGNCAKLVRPGGVSSSLSPRERRAYRSGLLSRRIMFAQA
jgi:16S rRNA (cytosine967-C5)-methyltransferase